MVSVLKVPSSHSLSIASRALFEKYSAMRFLMSQSSCSFSHWLWNQGFASDILRIPGLGHTLVHTQRQVHLPLRSHQVCYDSAYPYFADFDVMSVKIIIISLSAKHFRDYFMLLSKCTELFLNDYLRITRIAPRRGKSS